MFIKYEKGNDMKKKDLIKQGKIVRRNVFALLFFVAIMILFNTIDTDMNEHLKTYLNVLLVIIITGVNINLITQFKEYVSK